MLSWSNRQSLTVMMSGWFGVRSVERDLPSNTREMGDLTELAYSCPCMYTSEMPSSEQEKVGSAYRVVSLSYLSLALACLSLFFEIPYLQNKGPLVCYRRSVWRNQLLVERLKVQA